MGGGATGSKTANGWAKLSNGLIFQWGSTGGIVGDLGITPPIPFPTACLQAFASMSSTMGDSSYSDNSNTWAARCNGNNSIIVSGLNWWGNGWSAFPLSWMAIGY